MGWCTARKKQRGRREDIRSTQSLRECMSNSPLWARFIYWHDNTSGLNRLTKNLELALPIINTAFRYVENIFVESEICMSDNTLYHRATDAEAVSMARYVVQHDGLFLGSSSACNLVACVKLVKEKGWTDGQRIVTILWGNPRYDKFLLDTEILHHQRCDSGSRHYSKVKSRANICLVSTHWRYDSVSCSSGMSSLHNLCIRASDSQLVLLSGMTTILRKQAFHTAHNLLRIYSRADLHEFIRTSIGQCETTIIRR